ncbi:MAG: HEPN domain-containing protein [Magnetococcales bacterium]|nr:HEPN domain-containing protein [Magnetococcales bacterium]
MRKADHDLITARHTLTLPDGPTDTPCFHAQQAVEKAIKGILTAQGITFPRTHDLMPLLDLVATTLPEWLVERKALAELTGYGVEVRYPGAWLDPTREEAHHALATAERMVAKAQEEMNKWEENERLF